MPSPPFPEGLPADYSIHKWVAKELTTTDNGMVQKAVRLCGPQHVWLIRFLSCLSTYEKVAFHMDSISVITNVRTSLAGYVYVWVCSIEYLVS